MKTIGLTSLLILTTAVVVTATTGRAAETTQGQVFTLCFEKQTGLLLRFATEFDGTSLRYDWDEFRDVAGVKMPYKLSAQEGPYSYTLRFTEVKQNTPIDDAKFKRPKS